ncbi:MAG: hypothetical protein ABI207_07670 [Crocinitomicaceae bacterium]
MTKNDLFKIILKLFGLYSIIELIIQIPNIIFYLYIESNDDFNWLMLLIPIMSILVIYTLLFKPESVIQLFKLDKGYDNNEATNNSINGEAISKIALVIIAVYIIVSNLGNFITQLVFSFKESVSRNSLTHTSATYIPNPVNYNLLMSSSISLIIGFLLLTNYTRLSKWIEKINNKNVG